MSQKFLKATALAGPSVLFFLMVATKAGAYPGDVMGVGARTEGPKVQTLAGAPVGTYGVSQATGSAGYSVPIFAPPGRRGLAPSLGLVYSSHNPLRGGVAAGWTLPIESISVDTTAGRLAEVSYTSTLVGGQRLVEVDEPAAQERPGVRAFRGEHDDGYLRFEHVREEQGSSGYWRVLAPTGLTYYFGEAWEARDEPETWVESYADEGRWFINRVVDRFGNEILYSYEKVRGRARNGTVTNAPIDIALTAVEYTANPDAQLPSHARIELGYASSLAYCPGSDVPIGSQFTYRNGFRTYQGARQLEEVRVLVRNSDTSWGLRRKMVLNYEESANACDGFRGPLRILTSVQEHAYAPGQPTITLPPTVFSYGATERALDQERWIPTLRPEGTDAYVGFGQRRLSQAKAGGWPTLDVMWVDLDGDGVQDLIRSAPDESTGRPCIFQWKRNRGNGVFDGWKTGSLPTLPWAVADAKNPGPEAWTREQCSLAAQFSRRETSGIDPSCGYPANYTSYRFMDVTGDGRPDLVTALDYQSGRYDPNTDPVLQSMGQGGTCSAAPPCRDPDTGEAIACLIDPLAQTVLATWNSGPDQTGCPFEECRAPHCSPADSNCPCSQLWCSLPDDYLSFIGNLWTDPPIEAVSGSYWAFKGSPWVSTFADDAGGAAFGSLSCRRIPEMSCANTTYVWRVFENLGDGQFASQPTVINSPLPLESDRMSASVGTTDLANASSWHAIVDIDGDGWDDAVWQFPVGAYGYGDTGAFLVFRGDADGNFLPDASGEPYVWQTPPAVQGRRKIHALAGGVVSQQTAGQLHRFTETRTTLADINGDGLPDLIDNATDDLSQRVLQVYYNTGAGFEDYPAGTVLAAPADFETLDREVQVGLAFDQDTLAMSNGYSIATQRLADLDGDGLADMTVLPEPRSGQVNPWAIADAEGVTAPARAFMNVGDRFVPVGAPSVLQQMRHALGRITLSYSDQWRVKTDYFDFDGDGSADVYNADVSDTGTPSTASCDPNEHDVYSGTCGLSTRVRGDRGMRLLRRVDNGYGASVEFDYAPTTEVAPASPGRTNVPAPVWVATEMRVDPGMAGPTFTAPVSSTLYQYDEPVFTPDSRGRYDFRGFEQVTVLGPPNAAGRRAQTIERYAYDLDYTGRLVETVSAEESGKPISIARTGYQELPLFGGRVRTYHAVEDRVWTCAAEHATEASCIALAPVKRDERHLVPVTVTGSLDSAGRYPAELDGWGTPVTWAPDYTAVFDHDGAVQHGDRRKKYEYVFYYGPDVYHTGPTAVERQVVASTVAGADWADVQTFGRDEIVYDQDGRGLPVEYRVWLDSATVATSKQEFDSATGLLEASVTPNQAAAATPLKSQMTYDAFKVHPQTVTNELGHAVTVQTDLATGLVRRSEGPAQPNRLPVVEHDYDALGRLIATRRTTESSGSGLVTVYTAVYDDVSTPRKVTERSLIDASTALWSEAATRYDGLGRPIYVITATSAGQSLATNEYDAMGSVITVKSPSPADDTQPATSRYVYDEFGRLLRYLPPVGASSNVAYDGLRTVTTLGLPEELGPNDSPARVVEQRANAFGQLVELTENTDDGPATTRYAYAPAGHLKRIEDADQIVTTFDHDWGGRRKAIHRSGRSWYFSYDLNGNLESKTIPFEGSSSLTPAHTSTWVYDALDRVISARTPTAGLDARASELAIGTTHFIYDSTTRENAIGRLAAVELPFGKVVYDYTVEGLPAREQRSFNVNGPNGARISDARERSWHYNEAGAVRSATLPDTTSGMSTVVTSAYDVSGLPRMVRANGTLLASVSRRRAGNIYERFAGGRAPYQTWHYDDLGQVILHQVYAFDGWDPWLVTGEQINIDALGNVRSSRNLRSGIGLDFTYDAQHQLATVASEPQTSRYAASFEYTPGGRLSDAYVGSDIAGTDVVPRDVSYEYDAPPDRTGDPEWIWSLTDRATGAPFATFDYDPRGNRTLSSLASGDLTSFVHDGADELREAERNGTWERYYYDHTGARVLVVSSAFESEPARVRWYFGETEIWYQLDGTTEKTLAHVSLGAMPVARIENRTTIKTVYSGVRGDVLAVLNSSGQLEATFTYGPFGELLDVAGPKADEIRHRFNGKELDRLTRLSYYGARYYDRLSLTWTQADPLYRFAPDIALSDPRRMNLYTFVLNNPVRYVDPDGLDSDDAKKAASGGESLGPQRNDPRAAAHANQGNRGAYRGTHDVTYADGTTKQVHFYVDNGGDGDMSGMTEGQLQGEALKRELAAATNETYKYLFGTASDGSANSTSAGHDEGQEGGEGSYKAHANAQLTGFDIIGVNQENSAAINGASFIWMAITGGVSGGLAGRLAAKSASNVAGNAAHGVGFGSMRAFKRHAGRAGPGMEWHHIVEQTTGNVRRFGPKSIHNTGNLIRLDKATHDRVSHFYSSKQPFTKGQTVRKWLSTQSLEMQQAFGRGVLEKVGAVP